MSTEARGLVACATCLRPLGADEAKIFTVCDDCWDDVYARANPNGDRIREGERLRLYRTERDDARRQLATLIAERDELRRELESAMAVLATTGEEWDATDGAHPCWWRGHDNGSKGMAEALEFWRAEATAYRRNLDAEMNGNMKLRREHGARDDETMFDFVGRLVAERERVRAEAVELLTWIGEHCDAENQGLALAEIQHACLVGMSRLTPGTPANPGGDKP